VRFWQIIATSLDKASKNRFNNVDILIYSGKYCKKGRSREKYGPAKAKRRIQEAACEQNTNTR
jgi:hypothetical protein